jgi:hypothetical protein
MEVQVRFGGIARVTDQRDHLTALHAVRRLDAKTARLDVRVERVVPAADVDDDVITADRLERDRDRAGVDAGTFSGMLSFTSTTTPFATASASTPSA